MNEIEKNIPVKIANGSMGRGKGKPYAVMWGPDKTLNSATGSIEEGKRYWRLDLDHSHSTLHHVMNQVRKGNLLVQLYNLDRKNDDHNQIQDYYNGVSAAIAQTLSSAAVGIEATVQRLKKQKEEKSHEESESAR